MRPKGLSFFLNPPADFIPERGRPVQGVDRNPQLLFFARGGGPPRWDDNPASWTRRNWKRKSATFRLSQLGASRVCNVEEVHSKCRVLGHRNSVGVIGWECWPGKRSWDGPRIFIRRLSRAKH